MTHCRRVSIAGVSVSPGGFWAFLQVPTVGYWPVQITADPQDSFSATSPEALTILQLLSGVDMAGAILPPDILAKLVVLHAEANPDLLQASTILDEIDLPDGIEAYSDSNDWQRSRIRLPTVTLDELTLEPLKLDVTVKGIGPLSFTPSPDAMEEVCWTYDPRVSTTFVSLALALRYKAPIIVDQVPDKGILSSIQESFPLYRAVERLQQQSQRVTHNIERGFEIHQLTGALRIAMERGDGEAERKIREKLESLESMEELPTQGESDLGEMQ